ncbi:LpxL/LpxP family Kdo(2)-lipid IV(A) lauroyl/palmitoleoyl acyltransferase [Aestuariibacter sp. A3R04]|uniref:LpxL/LpxP family Kdo(2)-lipid IV(A) lauroyl/palmitoleoyl acyltransferase n=1 Tax=Aestuariibacter sp. A3R04 TaxID=2841571 RepID=UPI001C0A4F13|nr:LpxL/LpxP family Kdo(2)-lipid IV(A) lauroyl/palmitoleoyl acyltransferase [Aestuariibacter sp. A3R04]MBU3021732.1 LpxL/LpxP family Kdo(2)-lipid IV(A) lauroyl/palmitoleoyl acyltransferase [Aestuariibacter sp. A3R04]
MSAAIKPPSFSLSFLGPRFWGIWFGAGVLYFLLWLPFPVIRLLGSGAGKLIAKIVPKRVRVARRNLALMYPDMSEVNREVLLQRNIRCTGMALFETGMGWWWPAWRIKKHVEIEGYEHVEAAVAAGKGVFGMALHNMNLEFACRGLGYTHPAIAFYRKHDNPLMDYLQYHGRARSNKYMIHKRNAKALLAALDNNELCLYLPDQDYGRSQSIFVPFGGVKDTATTTATLMFIRRTNAVPIMITSQFTDKGYKIKFYPPMESLRDMDDIPALTLLNKHIEAAVGEQPESYLWMHKRFKTRPDKSAPSLYD